MTFEYRDDASCDKLVAQPDTDDNRKPVVFISTTGLNNGVYVPVDRVEEVVAGIRDTARTAAGRPAGPLTHTAAANAAAWAIAQEKAATDGAARTASGQTDGVKRSPDATVDPTMCPRCKGDNQEAFELCGNCTASGQQPETTPTCTSTHPARPTRCILPGRHAVPHTDGACQWPETVPAVGQPAEAQATDEARVEWDGTAADATRVIDWVLAHGGTATYTCQDSAQCPAADGATAHHISIRTADGTVHANPGARITRATTWTVEDER